MITHGGPKWGEDVFTFDAPMVKGVVEFVATYSPDDFILIVGNIFNSAVPLAAKVMKDKGKYDLKNCSVSQKWMS